MKNKKTIDAGTIMWLHDIVDSLAAPSVADVEMVRRLHAVAKELRNNFQGRIAFKTRSQSESRRIVDSPDADVLCAPGDMLVRQKDGMLARAQCAYSSPVEECKIIEELTNRYPRPVYLAEIPDIVFPAEPKPPQDKPTYEDLYNRALEVVRTTKRASISHLQRKMGIGYNHAAHLIDLLEDRGVIGPQIGAQPREILMTAEISYNG